MSLADSLLTNNSNGDGTSVRDYTKEAIEYFTNKLLEYGEGAEVPIKILMGHRSQAPPEVRHLSGQHFKDFKDFLSKHFDHFAVSEDNVMLKQYAICSEDSNTKISKILFNFFRHRWKNF